LDVPPGPDAVSWLAGQRAAFDVETTGRDPLQARLVSASVVLVDAGGGTLAEHEWLADPGIEIPDAAAQIHGISTERARAEGAPAEQVVRQLVGILSGYFEQGIPVLAFNAPYDFTVLAAESSRHGISAPEPVPVLDPFVLDKQMDRFRRGKRTLVATCEHYGVPLLAAHTSAADALATIRLAEALAGKFPELRIPARTLHGLQVGWAAEQAASFQEYLRRSNPDAVLDGRWPVGR
jgi:DNA polymerase-3 subunit epsilon